MGVTNTLLGLGLGMAGVGQIMSGYSASQAAKMNARLAEMEGQEASLAAQYNAAVSRANAQAIQASAELDIQRMQKAARALRVIQVARYAKGGVKLEGSPLAVMIDTAAEAELDQIITRFNAETAATQQEYAAREYERTGRAAVLLASSVAAQRRFEAKTYKTQGWMGGAGSLLKGAASFYQPSKKVT